MNSVRFLPPKATLAQRSALMRPIILPSGANTATPVFGLAAGPGAPQICVDIDPHAVAGRGLGAVEFAAVAFGAVSTTS